MSFLVGAISVIILDAYLEQRGNDLSPFEQAKRDYKEGRIDAAKFERPLDIYLNGLNEQIRPSVPQITKIDNALGDAISRKFEIATSFGGPIRWISLLFTG